MAIQLRRYEVVPGQMDDLLAWFPTIMEARAKFGFKVEFMLADREKNELTWAVSHPDDFDEAFERFAASPERAAAFADQPKRVENAHVAMVDVVIAPGS